MATSPNLYAHLFRRAGFGASPSDLARAEKVGWNATVDELLAGLSGPDPGGDRIHLPHLSGIPQLNVPGYRYNGYGEWINLGTWWLQRMASTSTPLREKLVLLLHNQFPTSWDKVGNAYLMYAQNNLFRTIGSGNFETLTQAVAKDPSMLIWLDADTNHAASPNENFARELMERFTMGIGNYTQSDVHNGARAFTGWELDMTSGQYYFNADDHDFGVKEYLGHRGDLSGEDVVHIATHTAASSRWVVARIWTWLAYPVTPSNPVVVELAKSYAKDLDIKNLLSAILLHPEFVSKAALNGLVKQPVEWVVGMLRHLGLTTAAFWDGELVYALQSLGQTPFAPPSVGGWGVNQYWLSTAACNSQLSFAGSIAGYADVTPLRDEVGNPGAQLTTLKTMLGVDSWSDSTYGALVKLTKSLGNYVEPLLQMALVSPEYLSN